MFARATIPIAALILLVAALQYRWIDRLSQSESDRLRADVQAGAQRFSQDFNSEIGRAFIALQGRPGAPPDTEATADRVAGWRTSSPWRRVIRGFYRTHGGASGMDEFLEYSFETDRFRPAPWPARLAELRSRLERRAPAGLRVGNPPISIEEDVPAVVGAHPTGTPEGERLTVGGWSILELDLEYIRASMFPELTRKHFGDTYDVRVVSRADAGRVIFGVAGGQPDASEPLLELRLGVRQPGPGGGWGRLPGLRPGFPGGRRPFREGPPEALPEGGEEGPPTAAENRAIGPPLRGPWVLQVTHRAGSVAAATGQRRARDLALSGVLLLLLAASVALVVVSTRRAQRLAHQQMEFVAGVTHELRTPLTVITSAADNLSDGVVAGEQQVKRYGVVIRQEARRLTAMVEQLLRFSGLQSGRARFQLTAVDVGPVIERAVAACQPDLRDSGIAVQVDVQADLPPVRGDAAALVHCLGNLIGNAIKHAREGGWVGISARAAEVGAPAVEILVEDRGPGLDAADLPHVFEPFYRGRKAVAGQIQGAGLGLSLVKRMMEGQSGSVSVRSRAGEGTVFTLRLPVATGGEG